MAGEGNKSYLYSRDKISRKGLLLGREFDFIKSVNQKLERARESSIERIPVPTLKMLYTSFLEIHGDEIPGETVIPTYRKFVREYGTLRNRGKQRESHLNSEYYQILAEEIFDL